MKADTKTTTEVLAVLDQMSKAYRQRSLKKLLSILVPDSDVFMFGTGADEKRIGHAGIQAQAERDWFQTDDSSFEIVWHSVSVSGPVAWVAADAQFNFQAGEIAMTIPARLTAVLEKRDEQWLIAQSHFSAPLAGQEEGESFPS
jgi:ketosteroid isomerase-like protein